MSSTAYSKDSHNWDLRDFDAEVRRLVGPNLRQDSELSGLRHLANRILFSRAYSWFYLLMLMLNFYCLWLIVDCFATHGDVRTALHNNSQQAGWEPPADGGGGVGAAVAWDIVALESVVNFALVLEVSLRLAAMGRQFFFSCSNLFDLVVMSLSCAAMLLYYDGVVTAVGDVEDLFVTVLLVCRYGVQFLRLILMVKNQTIKSGLASAHQDVVVDFSRLHR